MAEFLPRFAADRPLLELTVEARSSEELQSLFARGQLDITIAVVPKATPHGELLSKTHPVGRRANLRSIPTRRCRSPCNCRAARTATPR